MIFAFNSPDGFVFTSTRNWVAKWNDDYDCYVLKVDHYFIQLNPDSYGMIFACHDFIDDMTLCSIESGNVQLMPLEGSHLEHTFLAEMKIAVAERAALEK